MSELKWREVSLVEIAGLDDVQIAYVLNRRRDRHGNLIREDEELPPGVEVDDNGMRIITNPTSYGRAYVKAKMHYGVSEHQAKDEFRKWWQVESKHCVFSR